MPIDGLFEYWLIAVIALNSITVIIDTVDVVRYVKGERKPYLMLKKEGPGRTPDAVTSSAHA